MMPKYALPLLVLLFAFHAAGSLAEEGRVIVKYRDTSVAPWQTIDHSASLSSRLALALRSGRHLNVRMHVLRASGLSSEALAARLGRQSDVEYAVPDRLRSISALPNDPLFSGQWYLQATTTATPAAIDAVDAWNLTTGSATVVVADIDTGVRYDHPDLAANLLPGSDFIINTANGGAHDNPSTTDPAGSDPGDYISASDVNDTTLQNECQNAQLAQQDSSWHGTRVMGILGAAGNNGIGIAGTSWGVKLLPVRVLGKCGGFDSDIIAGMLWAAGFSESPVSGGSVNPNPAKIINLSLGGSGTCTSAYVDAIAQLTAKGVLVVVAAGNDTGPVGVPGNCPGVLTVAGLRNVGSKVGYSSFGKEVSVSAPAGNCVNSSGPCLYSIETTINLGTTVPAANGYTDETNYNIGTSFSSPQVAGVAALMLSLNPALQPADLIARIQQSASPFPVDNTLPTCPNYSNSGNAAGQCNCTTATCGAGMLDAAAAVAAALSPVVEIQTQGTPVAGTPIQLDGTGTKVAPGRTIVSWLWTLVSTPSGASGTTPAATTTTLRAAAASSATVSPLASTPLGVSLSSTNTPTTTLLTSTPGSYTVALTVTDNMGATYTAQTTLQVAAAATSGNTTSGAGGSGSSGSSGGGGGGGALDGATLLGLAGLVGLAFLSGRRKVRATAR